MNKKLIRIAAMLLMAGLVMGQDTKPARNPGHLFPAERVESLESHGRDEWQKPQEVMKALGIKAGDTVADIGAGGGYFTVKLARQVGEQGTVYACDIQKQLIEYINARVDKENIRNVKTLFGKPTDPQLPKSSLDRALIVDTYHEVANPVRWLRTIKDSLKSNGLLAIIDFKKNIKEGPGPPAHDRVEEATVIEEAEQAGFKLLRRESFLPYQYMLVFGKD